MPYEAGRGEGERKIDFRGFPQNLCEYRERTLVINDEKLVRERKAKRRSIFVCLFSSIHVSLSLIILP